MANQILETLDKISSKNLTKSDATEIQSLINVSPHILHHFTLIQTLKDAVEENITKEIDLLSKFAVVLNEKKKKIKVLQDDLKNVLKPDAEKLQKNSISDETQDTEIELEVLSDTDGLSTKKADSDEDDPDDDLLPDISFQTTSSHDMYMETSHSPLDPDHKLNTSAVDEFELD
ncbi:hypothetical protein Ciccas_001392 [Cichlidogyrus casuarinus]|uniref:Uncharacterized protein n=1 Tax=Cichlidogyrus casuarinus TaxID=1844966 RepID=A0ABD2QK82_9PLAT